MIINSLGEFLIRNKRIKLIKTIYNYKIDKELKNAK